MRPLTSSTIGIDLRSQVNAGITLMYVACNECHHYAYVPIAQLIDSMGNVDVQETRTYLKCSECEGKDVSVMPDRRDLL